MTHAKSRGGQRTTEYGQFDGMAHESRHARYRQGHPARPAGDKASIGEEREEQDEGTPAQRLHTGAQDPQGRGRTQCDGQHIARGREVRPRQHQHERDEERHPVIGPAPEDDETDRDPQRRQDDQKRDVECGKRPGERDVMEYYGAIATDGRRRMDEVLIDARLEAMESEIIHQDGGDEPPDREARQYHPHAPGNEEPDPMQTRLCGMG